MPKASRESASRVQQHGPAEDRTEELGGYTVNFVTIGQDMDLGPMLAGLPDGHCPCPHWGYVFKGRLTWRFADHQEVFEAGDAFYVPPGHAPMADAGSEFVQFSPSEELAAVEAAMMARMREMQGA
jgi:mannose-6-phosphate isomerase-like protein (cupin superfamily)